VTSLPREMSVPFAIDATGGVAYETDPVKRLVNRIVVAIGTRLNERVMRPGYGVALDNYVFDFADDLTIARLQNDIEQAIAVWEPSAIVVSIDPVQDPDQGLLGINVYFSTSEVAGASTPTVHTAFISTGGTVVPL